MEIVRVSALCAVSLHYVAFSLQSYLGSGVRSLPVDMRTNLLLYLLRQGKMSWLSRLTAASSAMSGGLLIHSSEIGTPMNRSI
jgi:hypothetical protein